MSNRLPPQPLTSDEISELANKDFDAMSPEERRTALEALTAFVEEGKKLPGPEGIIATFTEEYGDVLRKAFNASVDQDLPPQDVVQILARTLVSAIAVSLTQVSAIKGDKFDEHAIMCSAKDAARAAIDGMRKHNQKRSGELN